MENAFETILERQLIVMKKRKKFGSSIMKDVKSTRQKRIQF